MIIDAAKTRKRLLDRQADLIEERSLHLADWQDLNDYILPRRLRYLTSDQLKRRRNTKIINTTASRAVRVLESGIMAGMTNPSRPWQRFISDPEVMQIGRVALWLGRASAKVLQAYSRSNIYKCLPKFYGDLAVFGTAAMYVEPDRADVLRGYVLPIGQYTIAVNEQGRVDTLYREFTMTARNLFRMFGTAVSPGVMEDIRAKRFAKQITILHATEPRSDRDLEKIDSRNMAWASYWLEKDGPDTVGLLRESGFKRFPYMVARWEVTDDATDAYGDGPGLEALGDAIAIQLLEKRKAQTIDKITNPPMVGPAALRTSNVSLVPNGVTTVDVMQGGQQFKPAVEINHSAPTAIGVEIAAHEARINKTFFADLWLMMASSDRREITAREVDARQEEKMIQLGPTVDRTNDELIDPLAEFTVAELIDRGDLAPPPPELEKYPVRVDNISILGQAQKLVGTVALERFAGFAGNIAAVNKEILDNVDSDQLVRNYADMLGIDPSNLTDREKMEMLRVTRKEEADAAAMAEAAQPVNQAAQAAKVMSETDVRGDTALSRLMGSIGAEELPA